MFEGIEREDWALYAMLGLVFFAIGTVIITL